TRMVQQSFVSDQRAKDAADAACQLWRYHPDQAVETLSRIEVIPEPQFVADMIDGVNATNDESISSLAQAWKTIAGRMDLEDRVATGLGLLSKSANGTQDEPDLCLRLWIESKTDDAVSLLESLLTVDDLNDDQRRRVWLQIEQTEGLEA